MTSFQPLGANMVLSHMVPKIRDIPIPMFHNIQVLYDYMVLSHSNPPTSSFRTPTPAAALQRPPAAAPRSSDPRRAAPGRNGGDLVELRGDVVSQKVEVSYGGTPKSSILIVC